MRRNPAAWIKASAVAVLLLAMGYAYFYEAGYRQGREAALRENRAVVAAA